MTVSRQKQLNNSMKQKTRKQIKDMHEELSSEPRMFQCENCGSKRNIERNHALFYAGKKMEEPYALRALCANCHRLKNNNRPVKRADLVCKIHAITDGLQHLKANYPKRDWKQDLKRYLEDFKHYL